MDLDAPAPFPRWLQPHATHATNTRFVERALMVSCLRGLRADELGDRPRVVLDVRDPFSVEDGDGPGRLWESPELGLMPSVLHWRGLPIRDGMPVSPEAAAEAVDWYRGVRARYGAEVLVIVHCVAGRQRSPTIAYALLRRVHGLSHDEALRRVRGRDERYDRSALYPTGRAMLIVQDWCDALRDADDAR